MMRNFFLAFLIFVGFTSHAQSPFEGTITLKMSSSEKPDMGFTKLYFSPIGSRMETEMKLSLNMKPFKTVRICKNETPNVYYILNELNETYFISDLSNYQAQQKPDETIQVKVIGKEKILEYNCTHVIITGKFGETELWTTTELMNYDSYKKINESDIRSRNLSYAKALIEANAEGFPVKTVKKSAGGSAIVIELVDVSRKKPVKSLFEVPANYVKTQSPTTGLEGVMQEIKQMGDESLKQMNTSSPDEKLEEK
ncbi:MAG TPA: DUF4412 domain-containing protein [Bacteroidia bacterium]|nr:DUF4412 domain-containing protein [Bacteroidia bacterium]HRH07505.1 DUF4412 domain-containing protein [Bacteroidia bacterium]